MARESQLSGEIFNSMRFLAAIMANSQMEIDAIKRSSVLVFSMAALDLEDRFFGSLRLHHQT
jgi:hypothetical protein